MAMELKDLCVLVTGSGPSCREISRETPHSCCRIRFTFQQLLRFGMLCLVFGFPDAAPPKADRIGLVGFPFWLLVICLIRGNSIFSISLFLDRS